MHDDVTVRIAQGHHGAVSTDVPSSNRLLIAGTRGLPSAVRARAIGAIPTVVVAAVGRPAVVVAVASTIPGGCAVVIAVARRTVVRDASVSSRAISAGAAVVVDAGGADVGITN